MITTGKEQMAGIAANATGPYRHPAKRSIRATNDATSRWTFTLKLR